MSAELAEVFPVGELLADELEARGWTQADCAEILEFRFRQRFPELFAAQVRERGHRMLGDRVTASAPRFAIALGRAWPTPANWSRTTAPPTGAGRRRKSLAGRGHRRRTAGSLGRNGATSTAGNQMDRH
jgi:hypothetical protein